MNPNAAGVLKHGCESVVDRFVSEWVARLQLPDEARLVSAPVAADTARHYDQATAVRDQQMVARRPDLCLSFVTHMSGGGFSDQWLVGWPALISWRAGVVGGRGRFGGARVGVWASLCGVWSAALSDGGLGDQVVSFAVTGDQVEWLLVWGAVLRLLGGAACGACFGASGAVFAGVVSCVGQPGDGSALLLWLHCREDFSTAQALIARAPECWDSRPLHAFTLACAVSRGLVGLPDRRRATGEALRAAGFTIRGRRQYLRAELPIAGLPHLAGVEMASGSRACH
ncbi:hypothetical protein [Streptomyces broussonetiae]|uniref:Uncharacterized protein n=1 Tax=Streptomyces broussonetiae TaxID=2686304 RepID=A0A6I6MP93_9ACTN|nr:hypothetical protein [Streptomyces broussonetiae]QHA02208.1 hypothetical protein GQF42_01665 [Streptomyces broussonetiae]